MSYPYRQINIGYKGRAKYSDGTDSTSVVRSIKNFMGGGGGYDTRGGDGENRGTNGTSFFAYIDKGSGTYTDTDLAGTGLTETIHLYGFKNMDRAQTLVGDVSEPSACTQYDALTCTNPYNIIGFPSNGVDIEVVDNGTTGTTIKLTFSTGLSEEGELRIPVSVNVNDNPLDPYHEVWHKFQNWTQNTVLAFSWKKAGAGSTSYVVELSNDRAGVNVDSAGTIYTASTKALVCTATTWFGAQEVADATYSVYARDDFHASGYSINQNTGVLSFNYSTAPLFQFDGPSLPIEITAYDSNHNPLGVKTFTIDKNYPGANGSPAVTHWIAPSHTVVQYDPNTDILNPTKIDVYVMKQVGGDEPVVDSATTLWYWYNNNAPATAQTVNGYYSAYTYSVASSSTHHFTVRSAITFALKNEQGIFYETETIPTVRQGINGASGATGSKGDSGESPYYLSLNNDNASVNADVSGNPYQSSIAQLFCKGKLYHGMNVETAVTYQSATTATGVGYTVNGSGEITLNFGNNFNFTGDSTDIVLSAYTMSGGNNVLRDVKAMTISKVKDGVNGEPAVSYWLELSAYDIVYDPTDGTRVPSAITASAKKQEGGGGVDDIELGSGFKIQYQGLRRSGTYDTKKNYSGQMTITTGSATTYAVIKFFLMREVNGEWVQVDAEDVPIQKNGEQGPAGESRNGAAIRGPYDYATHSGETRCWCAGSSGDGVCQECEKWIDVVLCGNTYYYCNHSYNGVLTAHFPEYWTSGTSFDFVATNVLLASAASINFLTNNELYLRDENGDIVGGAKGTNVNSATTFWSGAQDPDGAPFRVDYEGNIYAKKGTFAGYIQFPFTNLNQLNSATTMIGGIEYEVYSADTRAYIIAYPLIDDTNRALRLPVPSSGLNGFTYDLIIHPALSRMERSVDLNVFVSGGTDIISYAFSTIKQGDHIILTSGRFQITCIPNYQGGYRWALISASGNLIFRNSGYDDEYVSTLLATSYDTQGMINNVHTYTGNKPSGWNDSTTMYVKK